MIAFAVSLAALAPTAQAQTQAAPTSDDLSAARLHFSKGKRLFDLGRYAEAAREYEAAYEAKDDPALLFNVGQAYRLNGDYQKAISAYKSYLRRNPHAKNLAELETRIADLQKLVLEQQRTQGAPPLGNEEVALPKEETLRPAVTTEVKHVPSTVKTSPQLVEHVDPNAGRAKRLAGIGLMAGGGAAIVVGATLTALAYQIQHDQSIPARGTQYNDAAALRMTREQISGATLLGVGGGAAVAGIVTYLIGRREGHAGSLALAPFGGRDSVGLALAGVLP